MAGDGAAAAPPARDHAAARAPVAPSGDRVPRGPAVGRVRLGAWRVAIIAVQAVSNLIGTAVVFVLAVWVIPGEATSDFDRSTAINLAVTGGYVLAAGLAGVLIGLRGTRMATAWVREGRPPTDREARSLLRTPLRVAGIQAFMWAGAVLLFTLLNVWLAGIDGLRVGTVVLIGGVATTMNGYLLCERVLRPLAGRVLAAGGRSHSVLLGVTARQLLTWGLGTGATVAGMALVGLQTLTGVVDPSPTQLAVTLVALGGVALVFGLAAEVVAVRAVADPVRSVRRALERVAEGDLDVRVPIYDGSQMGLLQQGFNDMVAGLAERERLQDLFGRHVGEDVARAALERGVELGGESREVAALFVDLVGSTRLASEQPAEDVVEVLNRFFGIVVDVCGRHRGRVDKFEGDAALVVWGAPGADARASDHALAAARELTRRLRVEVPEVDVGVGVSFGAAVAGNVGAAERFEYTVIGDPVNEAARLTDEAKRLDGRVAASGRLVEAAGDDERARWRHETDVELRGRAAATALLVPREPDAADGAATRGSDGAPQGRPAGRDAP